GIDDDDFPWGTTDDPLTDKHNYVIHAEANAILNYRGALKDLSGATAYVTLFPCQECAKTLAQAGIGEIVYLDDKYGDTVGGKIAKSVLDRCDVAYRQMTLPEGPLA
ncbi:MAG TPA: deaminase, partial [Atopobiaceae bacterium]|nr:deaminase [Atopobiaceae bacterium]